MTGSHHPRAEALKASRARLATVTLARDAGGCPGLAGRRARAQQVRPTAGCIRPPRQQRMNSSQALLLQPGPRALRDIFIVPADLAGNAGGLRRRAALRAAAGAGREEGFPETSATRRCRSSRSRAARRAPPTTSVRRLAVPGAPWRSGRALRRPRAASVRQVRPRRHHRAPTCGGAAEPRGGREGGRDERGRERGREAARHGGGGERRWRKRRGAALSGSTASWLPAPDRAG